MGIDEFNLLEKNIDHLVQIDKAKGFKSRDKAVKGYYMTDIVRSRMLKRINEVV